MKKKITVVVIDENFYCYNLSNDEVFYLESNLVTLLRYKHCDHFKNCNDFVEAVIGNILQKMKKSIEEKTAAKILKKVIKRQSTVRFKESDIRKALDAHFGNFICNEFIEETR